MKNGEIRISRWSGGLSPYPDRGPIGSFLHGRNLNIRNNKGNLQLNPESKEDIDSVVRADMGELLTNGFVGTDGQLYAFGSSAGVFIRDLNKDWTKNATCSHGEIVGSAEFEMDSGGGYEPHVVCATETNLYVDEFDASYAVLENAGTFHRGTGFPHRVVQALGVILVTDGDYIALLDRDDAFNATALRLPTGFIAQDIKEDGNIVRILGKTHTGRAKEYTWDTIQTSWITQKDIQMQGVNSADYFESGLLLEGNQELKYYDGANLEPLVRLPGQTGVNSRTLKDNLLHMGIWGGAEAGTKGIYSYGRRDAYSPLALNLEYELSHGGSGDSNNGEIGLVITHLDEIIVGWSGATNSPEYGVDIINDDANKATGVYESTQEDDGQPRLNKFFTTMTVMTEPISQPGYEISTWYMTNRNRTWQRVKQAGGVQDINEPASGQQNTKWIYKIQDKGEWIAVRFVIDGDDDRSPAIEDVIIDYHATGAL